MSEAYNCDIQVKNHTDFPISVKVEDKRETVILHIHKTDTPNPIRQLEAKVVIAARAVVATEGEEDFEEFEGLKDALKRLDEAKGKP